MTKPIIALALVSGMASAPLLQAQNPVRDFRTNLAARLINKSGNAAAKAAYRLVGRYVSNPRIGDPRKIVAFTRLAIKSVKRAANATQIGKSSQFFAKFVPFKYFRRGLRNYDPSDRRFNRALTLVVRKMPKSQKTDRVVGRVYRELLKMNNRLNGTPQDLYNLAETTYGAARLPNPVPPPVS